MRSPSGVLAMLVALAAITYVDRVCISVAGPAMQRELGIGPEKWGWVTGAFALAYALFEIPAGRMGDRRGPRIMLTRIVCWWSLFTALTGTVHSYAALLAARFGFGAGEAGAFPNMSAVVSSRFPASSRARVFGVIWTASQLGAALAPLVVVPVQSRWGWRASFFVFGFAGMAWCAVWAFTYRDAAAATGTGRGLLPWRTAIADSNVRRIMAIAFCYCFAMYFFLAWLPTYLAKARGFTDKELAWSSLPFLLAAASNGIGGFAGDFAVRRLGLTQGRRAIGIAGLVAAACCLSAALAARSPAATMALLSAAYAAIAFQQPAAWSVCVDIGRESSGTVAGFMNTAAQVGSFTFSLVYGYLVAWSGNYDAALVPSIAALAVGAWLWSRIELHRE